MTREELESVRLKAARWFAAGKRQADVVHRFNVSRTTASRWYRNWKSGVSLRMRVATGRPGRIPVGSIAELLTREEFSVGRHTTASIQIAIENNFGVRYDRDHVGRILHRIGMKKSGGRWVKEAV